MTRPTNVLGPSRKMPRRKRADDLNSAPSGQHLTTHLPHASAVVLILLLILYYQQVLTMANQAPNKGMLSCTLLNEGDTEPPETMAAIKRERRMMLTTDSSRASFTGC
jgi:hypothetical protein